MSANVNPSDSPPASFSRLPMMSTKLSPSLVSSVRPSLASTSSNVLLTHSSPSLTTTSKSGQIAKWGLHCSQEHSRHLPVLVHHWLHSHQRGMLSRPLPQLYSIFSVMNDVANEQLHGGFTYFFKKFLNILFKVWLICLPATTSAFSRTHWGTILKCSLNSETQFLIFVYISSTRTSLPTSYLHRCWAAAREHHWKSRFIKVDYHYTQYWSFFHFHFSNSVARSRNYRFLFLKFNMSSNIPIDSVDSDVFFVEQISNEPSPQRNNSPNILNSTEISHTHTAGMPSVSRSHPQNPKSWPSRTTPTSQLYNMDLDGSSRSFHRAWTTSTCRPIHLTSWQQWPW